MVSVLMPVYNASAYLEECLDSILYQSFADWELIAVDDFSTDESWSILQDYQSKNDRIKAFQNTAKGIIPALRLAFEQSKGDFVTRMDADDRMAQHKLKTLYNLLNESGRGGVATGLVEYFSAQALGAGYINYANWLNQLTSQQANFKDIYKECVIPSPCWMLHKADLLQCGAFEPSVYPEDYDLCFRMYEQKLKVISENTILHYWRDYPHRTSRTNEHYSDNRFLALKMHYFLKLDYQPQKTLYLWGAGKKGKWIAKSLIAKGINFTWVCNSNSKLGHNIYGVILRSFESINNNNHLQIIIAVAAPEEQQIILKFLSERGIAREDYFFFC